MATIDRTHIELKNLSFGFHKETPVLSRVNCKIKAHAFTVIMGQNGSGKSTLLRVLGGIMPYFSGSIRVNGRELSGMKSKERARLIGFLGQHHKAVFPFKVSDVVLTGRTPYIDFFPGKRDVLVADEAMEMVGVSSLRNRVYSELSGGEQQLVLIARILTQQPEILLLDEPISHLDYNNQLRIIKMIKKLVGERVTIVAVLHDPNMAYLFGDHFIYVHDKTAHEVQGNAWEHALVGEIFHDDLQVIEHDGKFVFMPHLS